MRFMKEHHDGSSVLVPRAVFLSLKTSQRNGDLGLLKRLLARSVQRRGEGFEPHCG